MARETQQTRQQSAGPHVGQDLGDTEFEVTEEGLSHYFDGLALDRGEGDERSPFGRAVAPSMLVLVPDSGLSTRGGFANAFGNLWMRQQWELERPLIPGERYRCAGKVVDIYERRDRTVVQAEVSVLGADGQLMARGMHHQSYLLGQTSGDVPLRDPKAKEGARRFDVPGGEDIGSLERSITLEMCGTFFHGRANYHTDKQAAAELGFRDIVVGGRMTLSYLGELMERRFGRGWWEGGRLDAKFTNIVWPQDTVTARGVITDREPDGDRTRAHVFAWVEKDDGTPVIVASGSALE